MLVSLQMENTFLVLQIGFQVYGVIVRKIELLEEGAEGMKASC